MNDMAHAEILSPNAMTRQEWAGLINGHWRSTVSGILSTCEALLGAREQLSRDEFRRMREQDLVFSRDTADCLIAIAGYEPILQLAAPFAERARQKTIGGVELPPSWYTLYELARLPYEDFDRLKEAGMITADLTRADIKRFFAAEKVEEIKQRVVTVMEGEYETIVIDPPWQMQKIEREVRPNQVEFEYPTMSEEQLAAVELPVAPDCHLFCWTTHKFLPMALRLLDVWGFRYVCTMVWHKPGGFQPIGLPQYNCEFALYARKGSPKFVETKSFNTCFEAPRREHSRKPDEFYDMIKRVTAGPRIDVFSRELRDGFDQFGNEMDKFG